MNSNKQPWLRAVFSPGLFSAKGLVIRASVIAAVFLVCHAAGLREYTTVLSGTSPTGNTADKLSLAFAVLYALSYFGLVLAVPILLLAAAILRVVSKPRP